MAWLGLLWLATWTLRGRDGSDDKLAASATWKRHACLLGRGLEKILNLWLRKHVCGRKANKARLLARPGKDPCRIGQSGAADETQADAVCSRGDRDKAVRWTLTWPETDHEKVVVVVDKFICCREALPQ